MLWSLLPRFDKFVAPGVLLARAEQPRLFAELESITATLHEPMPRQVYLVGDVNAFVADRGGFLGIGSRRVMGLGLPLFSILTVSQFRAVLAHEFAHHYGGDTSLGPWVYKTQRVIVRIFENVRSLKGLARLAILGMMYVAVATRMKWYFQLFLRVINLASRRRECRADELACLIAGRRPLVDGLRALNGAAPAWATFWKTEVAPVLGDGVVPGIVEGFASFTSVPEIGEQIGKYLDTQIREEKANPYNSRPPLRDRLAAAETFSAGEAADDSTSARGVLDKADATEIRWLEHLNPEVKPGTLTSIRWDEVASRVTLPRWRKSAAEYSFVLEGVTAESLPEQVPTLRQIGAGIRDPVGMLLDPAQRAHRAGQLFGVGLALALLADGWTLTDTPGVFYFGRDGRRLNPFVVMDQLMADTLSAEDWRAQCAELGIGGLILGPPASR